MKKKQNHKDFQKGKTQDSKQENELSKNKKEAKKEESTGLGLPEADLKKFLGCGG